MTSTSSELSSSRRRRQSTLSPAKIGRRDRTLSRPHFRRRNSSVRCIRTSANTSRLERFCWRPREGRDVSDRADDDCFRSGAALLRQSRDDARAVEVQVCEGLSERLFGEKINGPRRPPFVAHGSGLWELLFDHAGDDATCTLLQRRSLNLRHSLGLPTRLISPVQPRRQLRVCNVFFRASGVVNLETWSSTSSFLAKRSQS